MQIYAIKMHNFFRFGDKDNCVIFDILPEYKETPLDDVYKAVIADPCGYVKKVKEHGISNLISIAGIIGDSTDNSNGAGKSTVLEAICYAFYEQLIRKTAVKTDAKGKVTWPVITTINGEIPTDVTETFVEMVFEEDDKIYLLKRGRKIERKKDGSLGHTAIHNFKECQGKGMDSMSGHRKDDTNTSLDKVISMDYDIFASSVMFGQSDAGKFLTQGDKARKEMLISLLHLDEIIQGCLKRVRDRKNAKQKDIENLEAQLVLLTESLKQKDSVDNIKLVIASKEAEIRIITEEMKAHQTTIEELSKSDVLKELESLKTESARLESELKSKQVEKGTQTREWTNLAFGTDRSIAKKAQDLDVLIRKGQDIAGRIKTNQERIASFKVDEINKTLKTIEQAKAKKPERAQELKAITDRREKAASDLAVAQSGITLKNEEIAALQKQIKDVKGDDFVCKSCKSKVARSHIEGEITKLTKEKGEAEKAADGHNKVLAEIRVAMKEVEDKLAKIDSFLAKEAPSLSSLKEHENNKAKEKDFATAVEENTKSIESVKAEQVELEVQKKQYEAKMVEIGRRFDGEILEVEKKCKEVKAKADALQSAATQVNIKITTERRSIEVKTGTVSMRNSEIGACKKDIENIEGMIQKQKDLMVKLGTERKVLERLEFLDTKFGLDGVQTRIIAKYINLLNNYIAEFMDVLSNGMVSIKLDITKDKEITIQIKGGTADNFEQLSGGEKMICRLAVNIGLALLSFARCTRKPEIICLDEVFGPLDNSHIKSVFALLERLKNRFTRVLVISHKAEINDAIPNQIIIEKGEGMFGRSRVKKILSKAA